MNDFRQLLCLERERKMAFAMWQARLPLLQRVLSCIGFSPWLNGLAIIGLLSVVSFQVSVFCDDLHANQDNHGKVISFDKLEQSKLLGRLDLPFGEFCSIEGVWYFDATNSKEPMMRMRVRKVNGKPLGREVVVRQIDIRVVDADEYFPKEGEVWDARGYEVLAHTGAPKLASKEYGEKLQGFLPPFRLSTRLILHNLHRTKG